MKLSYALICGSLLAATPAWAVYAPVPEQEQGKDLTTSVRAGFVYDSNIFGASGGAINSSVYQLAPSLIYNASLTDQTFFSAHYGLTLDYIERRPGTKLLDSHEVTVRLAHAFSKSSNIDIFDTYALARNPESVLPGLAAIGATTGPTGVVKQTDQSYQRNQADARYTTAVGPKVGVTVKARSTIMAYRNGTLGRLLDRVENLYGLAGDYAVLPEMKTVAEYRHQDVYYRKQGVELKNKRSDYLMAGIDYEAAKKLTLSSRVGAEWRQRVAAPNETGPFVEVSARYAYAERSMITGGAAYTLDETSDPTRFSDQRVTRYFVNVQHAFSALIVGSLSVDLEPATLNALPLNRPLLLGETAPVDVDETTERVGFALSYLPTKNWTVSATYDYDQVDSDDPNRKLERHRVGISATYSF